MDPSVRNPHACQRPTDTDVKRPAGGDDSPNWLLSQQAMVPSVRNPHDKDPKPADTDVKRPDGGDDSPK